MKLINRTGQVITIKTYKWEDGLKSYDKSYEYIHKDQHWSSNQGFANAAVSVWHGRVSPSDFFLMAKNTLDPNRLIDAGPCSNTEAHIIRKSGKTFKIIHWSKVEKKWKGNSIKLGGDNDGNNANIEKGLQAGMILLSGLATGIAALGPVGAAPSGLIMGFGNLILFAFMPDNIQPPPPPNLEEIQDAVRKVVKEELDITEAEKVATSFEQTSNWFYNLGNLAHSQLQGRGAGEPLTELSQHDKQDAINKIENIISGLDPFEINLAHMNRYPEIARAILPAYISGIASSLHIRRLHEWLRRKDGSRITDDTLTAYLTHLNSCITGLDKARTSFVEHCSALIAADGLDGIAEAEVLKKLYNKTRCGEETLDFVDKAIGLLDGIRQDIQSDIDSLKRGENPIHFWKEEWFKSAETEPA
ncbi:hypothetical protein [Microbulbifer sp. Q7]|uniref:hypothetical protein n=1 Tax=Microbulbifer sp. Q7 TaxID=1785091 RepID=UPI00082EA96D|nr:hypothetical protein [Microbulbifer sp. Q7]